MNRRLLDPFQSVELPETIEEFLDDGVCQCVAFNRRGTLLAAGCADGSIVIWDIETRGVAQRSTPHSAAVTSVAWSKDGHFLLSGSLDKAVSLWDLQQNAQEHYMSLEGSVVQVSLHPGHLPSKCIASFAVGSPVLVDFASNAVKPLPALVMEGEGKNSKPAPNTSMVTAVALFDKAGDLIYIGQSKGTITVLDANSLKFLDIVKVPGASRIMSMSLNRRGTRLLVNCYDRAIRLYETCQLNKRRRSYTPADLKARLASNKMPKQGSALMTDGASLNLLREFSNKVERWQWRAVAFSNDDEHIVAASTAKNEHIMYIWNAHVGNLERILEGPKEGALDLLWHPLRSCLASVSTTGKIYLWAPIYRENWSAFAPDFEELEENREYIEREDEFDINEREEDRIAAAAAEATGEDADVDIMTIEDEPFFSSDEEQEQQGQQLHYLPVTIRKPPLKAEANGAADVDDGMDEDDDEDAVPAVRLGDAEREASQSVGQSLAPSTSGQYDSTGLSNEDGAARGRQVNLKVKLTRPGAKVHSSEDQHYQQQDARATAAQKKKRRRH